MIATFLGFLQGRVSSRDLESVAEGVVWGVDGSA